MQLVSKFPQKQKFRQIRQNRQQNFVKSAIFVTACISGHGHVGSFFACITKPIVINVEPLFLILQTTGRATKTQLHSAYHVNAILLHLGIK